MDIIVVTHNGKLPKDGGLRIAYTAGDMYFHLPTGKIFSLASLKMEWEKTEKARLVALGLVVYDDLPECNRWGDCHACGQENNPQKILATDQGEKKLVICCKCGRKMRYRTRL